MESQGAQGRRCQRAAAAVAGTTALIDPIKGKLAQVEKDPAVSSPDSAVDNPKLAMDRAINVQQNIMLPDNPMLPNIGDEEFRECETGIEWSGSGGGMGSGSGRRHWALATEMDTGRAMAETPAAALPRGRRSFRSGRSIFQPEAEFSDEARRAKYQGICLIAVDRGRAGKSAKSARGPRAGYGIGREGPGGGPQIQIQTGHEGRQDAGSGDDQRRGKLPAVLNFTVEQV